MRVKANTLAITLGVTIVSGILLHVHSRPPLLAVHLLAAASFTTMATIHALSHRNKEHGGFGKPQETLFIELEPKKCQACWACIEACPKQVIGKIDFSIHKHAKVVNPDACIGCKKCVKVCQYDAVTAKEKK